MSKKMLAVLMAVSMAVSAGGCSGGGSAEAVQSAETTKEKEKTTVGTKAPETEAIAEFSYPMESGEAITWWKELNTNVSANFTSMRETPVIKGLIERTGIEVEFMHPPAGQTKEQFGLLLADGDLPDVIEYNWLVEYPGGPAKAISDGIVQPLNDIIDQYCPNFKKYLEENPEVDKMIKTDEGQYYAFPLIRDEAETIQIGPMMRGDWLEELNMDIPTTIDEWHDVLAAFKEQKGASAPYSYNYGMARIRNSDPIALAYVVSPNFYVGDDGKIYYGSVEEGYKKYLETMSQWYKEGLVDIDLASQKDEQVTAKMTSGQTGASIAYAESGLGTWMKAGRKDNPDFRLVGVPWPTEKKGEHPKSGYRENRYSGMGSAVITTDCKDVERAARFIDYNYSEEGHMYVNFGEEGVTYHMVDGNPVFTDVILNNPDGWTMKQAIAVYTMSTSSGPHARDPRVPAQTMDLPEIKEARYTIWPDTDAKAHLVPPIIPSMEENKEYAAIMNEIETYRDEMAIKYIMGQEGLDTFDQFVDNIYRLGLEKALEIQNNALQRYYDR